MAGEGSRADYVDTLRCGMAASYNQISTLQRRSMENCKGLLDCAVERILQNEEKEKGNSTTLSSSSSACKTRRIQILDCGCATGKNSSVLMQIVLQKLYDVICNKEKMSDNNNNNNKEKEMNARPTEVCVYHNDTEGTEWSILFSTIFSKEDGYIYNNPFYQNKHNDNQPQCNIFAYGVCNTMYERLVPTECLSLVGSFNSLHWVEEVPHPLTDGVFEMYEENENIRKIWKERHARSIQKFLTKRNEEMKKGAYMSIVIPTTTKEYNENDNNCNTTSNSKSNNSNKSSLGTDDLTRDIPDASFWRHMHTALKIMQQKGSLSEETVKKAVVPVCYFTLDELIALFSPSSSSPASDGSSALKIRYKTPPKGGVANSLAAGEIEEGAYVHPTLPLVLHNAYFNTIVHPAFDRYKENAKDTDLNASYFCLCSALSKDKPMGCMLPTNANPKCIQMYYKECVDFIRGAFEHLVRIWMKDDVENRKEEKKEKVKNNEEEKQTANKPHLKDSNGGSDNYDECNRRDEKEREINKLVNEYFDTLYSYVCFKRDDGIERFSAAPPHPVKLYFPMAYLLVEKV